MKLYYAVEKNNVLFGEEHIEYLTKNDIAEMRVETNLLGYSSAVQLRFNVQDFGLLSYNKIVNKQPLKDDFSLEWLGDENMYVDNYNKNLLTGKLIYSAEMIKFFLPILRHIGKDQKYYVYDERLNRILYYKICTFSESTHRIVYPEFSLCCYDKNGFLETYERTSQGIKEYLKS